MPVRPQQLLVLSAAAALLAAPAVAERREVLQVLAASAVSTAYDGVSDDLLTAGLGAAGLQSATAPVVSATPTAAELRRLAIYNNYRALVDTTAAGGYGTFYGPTATATGAVANAQGTVAGTEVLAYAAGEDGGRKVTVMVQIPASYDPAHGCIVAAPSSGSRGVYGAIATAGEWGLKHGCAVAYTDKGTGTGFHDLGRNVVDLLRGEPAEADAAGPQSEFTAPITAAERAAFNAAYPDRFATKHAHSQVNPEQDWGQDVLVSIKFTFALLDRQYGGPGGGRRVRRDNTVVIASSVSNGGGASLRAAEQDREHLIDGVAVSEPNVNPVYDGSFTINQAGRPPLVKHSRTLIDYITLENVFEGCAAAGYTAAQAPLNLAPSPERCASLHAAGLLQSAGLAGQAAEAQRILNDFGILPEQNLLQPVLWFSYVPQSIATTYANAYGRFSVLDNLCGYSIAGIDTAKHPAPLAPALRDTLFGTSNGIPPTGGLQLTNNAAGLEDRASTPDQDLAGALCLRSLATGQDAATGAPLGNAAASQAQRIQAGVRRILADGDLHGVPAVVVTGRSDDILPPNFASRAYFGLNNRVEGRHSRLRYYEVTNAQHLDNIIALPGFDTTLVPLHRYFVQAMDLMYAHLIQGAPLPPSQVVHTAPRGGTPGAAPVLTAANVPPISASPGGDAITFAHGAVNIPD
jgi:hydroxybutyrate-dimer hydrolase